MNNMEPSHTLQFPLEQEYHSFGRSSVREMLQVPVPGPEKLLSSTAKPYSLSSEPEMTSLTEFPYDFEMMLGSTLNGLIMEQKESQNSQRDNDNSHNSQKTDNRGISDRINHRDQRYNHRKTSKISRSRFGCAECKIKRMKCDETKPQCSTCASRGLTCQYQLKLQFREDYERKGKKFGREGVWSKGCKKGVSKQPSNQCSNHHTLTVKNPLLFVNFFYKDMMETVVRLPLKRTLQTCLIPPDINCFNTEDIGYAMKYFVEKISPIFDPLATQEGDLGRIVDSTLTLNQLAKYSHHHRHIYYLLLALGAGYLSRTNDSWKYKCYQLKLQGMKDIREELEFVTGKTQTGKSPVLGIDIFVSLFLLLLIEISTGSDDWSQYLKVGKTLLTSPQFQIHGSPTELVLLRFALEFFYYSESLGRTVCRDKNGFAVLLENSDWNEGEEKLVPWMGCDRSLVVITSDITDLALERGNMDQQGYDVLCEDIRNKLELMRQKYETDEVKQAINQEAMNQVKEDSSNHVLESSEALESRCFLLTCQIKRLSTLIYFECSLLSLDPQTEAIKAKVHQVYEVLEILIKFEFKWYPSLLWCLFMAGVEISVTDSRCDWYRYLTLKFFDKLQPMSWSDVPRVKDIVLNVWKMRDMGNGNMMEDYNDWERYVSDSSVNVTLA